jgi:hypothetical protein
MKPPEAHVPQPDHQGRKPVHLLSEDLFPKQENPQEGCFDEEGKGSFPVAWLLLSRRARSLVSGHNGIARANERFGVQGASCHGLQERAYVLQWLRLGGRGAW